MGGIMNVLAMPSRVLREAVTRDPGFILVNLMRDTMSAFVTSGADYVPIIDTAKGFFSPLSDLEMLGVVGGYDFAADPRDAVKFFKQLYKKTGDRYRGWLSWSCYILENVGWSRQGDHSFRCRYQKGGLQCCVKRYRQRSRSRFSST